MAPGGTSVKLHWTPTPDQLHDRVRKHWPDAVVVTREHEALFYADQHARDEWDQHGLTESNRDLLVHALWTDEGVFIVVGSDRSRVSQFIIGWTEPVYIGDTFDIVDSHEDVIRTVNVVRVTKRSFQTSDGVKWSLVGMTPWARYDLRLKAVRVRKPCSKKP